MKKISRCILLLVLSVGFTSAFAQMKLVGDIKKLSYEKDYPSFNATITGADYYYYGGKPFVSITFTQENKGQDNGDINLDIHFSGADLAAGMAFVSSVGKRADIFFANKNFDVDQVHVDALSPDAGSLVAPHTEVK